jgi:addiction module HigA family antidote
MLLKEFLEPMGMTQVELAKRLGWTWARLNEIVNGRRGVSAASALAFGEAFGTGPEFWLNLQRDWDLWHAQRKHAPVRTLKKAS